MRKYFEVRCSGSESLSNSSEFWKTVGPFISDKDHSLVIRELPTLMLFFLKMIKLKNDKIENDKLSICNLFNDHFINITDNLK